MSSALDRSVLEIVDIKEQPVTPYVMVAATEHFGWCVFAIDAFTFNATGVRGYRKRKCICAFPATAEVFVLSRSVTRVVPYEERLRQAYTDRQQMRTLVDALTPKADSDPAGSIGAYL